MLSGVGRQTRRLVLSSTQNVMHNNHERPAFRLTCIQALQSLLPLGKPEMDPKPAVIDEVPFEESDIADVREPPFPGNFFHNGYANGQFGEAEDDWEDEDEEDEEGVEPECRQQ